MAKERQLKGERKVWAQKPKPSMSPSLRQGNQGTKRAMPAKLQDDVKAGILPRAREAKAAAEHREFSPNSNAQEVKAEMLQHIQEASNIASSHHRVQPFAPSQPKRAKVASSEQMKGLSCLTEEEKARLVTVPECLEKEIGLKFHKHSNARQSVKCFFERYLQIGRIDHYWETKPESVPGQRFPLYRSKLRTPSLFNQTFEGQRKPRWFKAELSACEAFLQDPTVLEIAEKLPPSATKVRRYVQCKLTGWKKDLIERGINVKLVIEEAKAELFSRFQSMGCRTALWDGNA